MLSLHTCNRPTKSWSVYLNLKAVYLVLHESWWCINSFAPYPRCHHIRDAWVNRRTFQAEDTSEKDLSNLSLSNVPLVGKCFYDVEWDSWDNSMVSGHDACSHHYDDCYILFCSNSFWLSSKMSASCFCIRHYFDSLESVHSILDQRGHLRSRKSTLWIWPTVVLCGHPRLQPEYF